MVMDKKILIYTIVSLICYSLFISATIYLINGSFEYHKYDQYKEYDCLITRIEYASRLPMIRALSGWIRCDSGGYTGCMKLYATNVSNEMIKKEYLMYGLGSSYDVDNDCTYRFGNCETSVTKLRTLINEMEFMNNQTLNTNITCYYRQMYADIYLSRKNGLIIGVWITSLIYIIFVLLSAFIAKYKKRIDRNQLLPVQANNTQQSGIVEVPPKYDEISIASDVPLEHMNNLLQWRICKSISLCSHIK